MDQGRRTVQEPTSAHAAQRIGAVAAALVLLASSAGLALSLHFACDIGARVDSLHVVVPQGADVADLLFNVSLRQPRWTPHRVLLHAARCRFRMRGVDAVATVREMGHAGPSRLTFVARVRVAPTDSGAGSPRCEIESSVDLFGSGLLLPWIVRRPLAQELVMTRSVWMEPSGPMARTPVTSLKNATIELQQAAFVRAHVPAGIVPEALRDLAATQISVDASFSYEEGGDRSVRLTQTVNASLNVESDGFGGYRVSLPVGVSGHVRPSALVAVAGRMLVGRSQPHDGAPPMAPGGIERSVRLVAVEPESPVAQLLGTSHVFGWRNHQASAVNDLLHAAQRRLGLGQASAPAGVAAGQDGESEDLPPKYEGRRLLNDFKVTFIETLFWSSSNKYHPPTYFTIEVDVVKDDYELQVEATLDRDAACTTTDSKTTMLLRVSGNRGGEFEFNLDQGEHSLAHIILSSGEATGHHLLAQIWDPERFNTQLLWAFFNADPQGLTFRARVTEELSPIGETVTLTGSSTVDDGQWDVSASLRTETTLAEGNLSVAFGQEDGLSLSAALSCEGDPPFRMVATGTMNDREIRVPVVHMLGPTSEPLFKVSNLTVLASSLSSPLFENRYSLEATVLDLGNSELGTAHLDYSDFVLSGRVAMSDHPARITMSDMPCLQGLCMLRVRLQPRSFMGLPGIRLRFRSHPTPTAGAESLLSDPVPNTYEASLDVASSTPPHPLVKVGVSVALNDKKYCGATLDAHMTGIEWTVSTSLTYMFQTELVADVTFPHPIIFDLEEVSDPATPFRLATTGMIFDSPPVYSWAFEVKETCGHFEDARTTRRGDRSLPPDLSVEGALVEHGTRARASSETGLVLGKVSVALSDSWSNASIQISNALNLTANSTGEKTQLTLYDEQGVLGTLLAKPLRHKSGPAYSVRLSNRDGALPVGGALLEVGLRDASPGSASASFSVFDSSQAEMFSLSLGLEFASLPIELRSNWSLTCGLRWDIPDIHTPDMRIGVPGFILEVMPEGLGRYRLRRPWLAVPRFKVAGIHATVDPGNFLLQAASSSSGAFSLTATRDGQPMLSVKGSSSSDGINGAGKFLPLDANVTVSLTKPDGLLDSVSAMRAGASVTGAEHSSQWAFSLEEEGMAATWNASVGSSEICSWAFGTDWRWFSLQSWAGAEAEEEVEELVLENGHSKRSEQRKKGGHHTKRTKNVLAYQYFNASLDAERSRFSLETYEQTDRLVESHNCSAQFPYMARGPKYDYRSLAKAKAIRGSDDWSTIENVSFTFQEHGWHPDEFFYDDQPEALRGYEPGCTTISGPRSGEPCAFPFTHHGVTHRSCTSTDSNEFWCYTLTDSTGKGEAGWWGNCGDDPACFEEVFDPGSAYVIENVYAMGKYLNVVDNVESNGAGIQLWDNPESTSTQWRIVRCSSGAYTLESVEAAGEYLNDVDNAASNGATIQLWDNPKSASTQWHIAQTSEGTFTIESAKAAGKFLNIVDNNISSGTRIQLWDNPESPSTQWRIFRVPELATKYAVSDALTEALANPRAPVATWLTALLAGGMVCAVSIVLRTRRGQTSQASWSEARLASDSEHLHPLAVDDHP